MNENVKTLTLPDRRIAYQQQSSSSGRKEGAGVIFLGGFASDMTGTKASFLAGLCAERDWPYLRFDYRGHGVSSDTFENGTIGGRADDALQVLDRLTEGPQILVGSSMGGWIGLLLARARPDRVAGFVGVAAAPDFTEDLIRPSLTPRQKEQLERDGKTYEGGDSPDQGPPVTQKLMEEAKGQLVLRSPLAVRGPVHLIQGLRDDSVPWQTALKIADHLESPDLRVTLIKDGDHRLNRPEDLALQAEILSSMMLRIG